MAPEVNKLLEMVVRRAIIISLDSDIGAALAHHWRDSDWQVVGTYLAMNEHVRELQARDVMAVACDLADGASVDRALGALQQVGVWDVVVVAAGTLNPIGPFESIDSEAWEASVAVNFTRQLRCVRGLLPQRRTTQPPTVIFFAGGGVNSAPVNFSAYTVSKIALIKMSELLAAEMPDTKFVALGPGWVKTKIHEETLTAGQRAGTALVATTEKLRDNTFTPMERVVACCDWVVDAPREVVSGRNISVAYDAWGSDTLAERLQQDTSLYTLRRAGN